MRTQLTPAINQFWTQDQNITTMTDSPEYILNSLCANSRTNHAFNQITKINSQSVNLETLGSSWVCKNFQHMYFTGFISLHLNHNPIKVDVTLMISSHADGFSLIPPFGSPFLRMNSGPSERSGGLFQAHYTTRSDTPHGPVSPALSTNFIVRPPSHLNANDPRFEWLPGIWLGRYQLELISSQGCDNVITWDSFCSSSSPRERRTNNFVLSLAEQMLRLKAIIFLSSPSPYS